MSFRFYDRNNTLSLIKTIVIMAGHSSNKWFLDFSKQIRVNYGMEKI